MIAYRYRESNKKAKYSPDWSHSNLLEAIWWFIPRVIIVILAIVTWVSTHWLDPYKPINTKAMGYKTKAVKIDVVALRWKWLFIYPQYNIATVNFIEFPVNTQVSFSITSDAPMNAIQIVQLGGQIYSMNGMVTKLHLLATKQGDYSGRSVSFSGTGFAGMLFTARVTDQATFSKWVQKIKRTASPLTKTAFNQLALPSEFNPVQYFAPVAPDLYKDIVQKFDSPDRHNIDSNVDAVSL